MMNLKEIAANKWTQIVGALVAGIMLGMFVMPTKETTEDVTAQYEKEIQILKTEHAKETSYLRASIDFLAARQKQLVDSYEAKINTLTSQVRELTSHRVEIYYKIVKPDGTIEEKRYIETEDKVKETMLAEMKSEYERQMKVTEQEYQKRSEQQIVSVKAEYQVKVDTLERELSKYKNSTQTVTNPKKLGAEIGFNTDQRVYLHTTYDAWGPIFIGGQIEKGTTSTGAGIGIGVRF